MFDYRKAIHDCFEDGEVNPYRAAATVCPVIPEEELRAVVEELMPYLARNIIQAKRANGRKGSLKGLLHEPVFVPGKGWAKGGQLTAEDCDSVAEYYEQLAEANLQKARDFRFLAEGMRAENCKFLSEYWTTHRERSISGVREAFSEGTRIGTARVISDQALLRVKELLEEGLSDRKVIETLNEEGIPTPFGRPWSSLYAAKVRLGLATRKGSKGLSRPVAIQ